MHTDEISEVTDQFDSFQLSIINYPFTHPTKPIKARRVINLTQHFQLLISRALKSQYFVYFQLNHAASRLVRNELCAFIELIFSENKHFE